MAKSFWAELRAMVAAGMSQWEIALALGINQSAASQQMRAGSNVSSAHLVNPIDAAAPVLRRLAENAGFSRLAFFGSGARREAAQDSDIDLLIEVPEGTSSFAFVTFQLTRRTGARPEDRLGGL